MQVMAIETANHPRDYRAIIIIATLVALTVNGALVGWGYWISDRLGHVELTNLHVIGDTKLCPGELLVYDFTMTVSQPATVDLSTTIERMDAILKTVDSVSYTSVQQFRNYAPGKVTLRRNVYFGDTYTDPETGQQREWLPGDYRQRTTASVIGRSEFSELEVPFTVRRDCPGKPED